MTRMGDCTVKTDVKIVSKLLKSRVMEVYIRFISHVPEILLLQEKQLAGDVI